MFKTIHYLFLYLCIFLFCINEYNPYNDINSARVHIRNNSFLTKDSIKIFSAETLSVSLTVKHLIDSFSVFAPNNRLWTKKTFKGSKSLLDDYNIIFSFFDTGKTIITINTFLNDNSDRSNKLSFRTFSPLMQQSIFTNLGDTFTLSTPPVNDHNVIYYWSFGNDTNNAKIVKSNKCKTSHSFTHAFNDSTGYLFVSDDTTEGIHYSPKHLFTFHFKDNNGPVIECLNSGIANNSNYIKTGDKTFALILNIYDTGNESIAEALINNTLFDNINTNSNIYTKYIENMNNHLFDNPYKVNISALDNALDSNITYKSFLIYFDSTMDVSPNTIIFVDKINPDSTETSLIRYLISGSVRSTVLQEVTMKIYRFNTEFGTPLKISADNSEQWVWEVALLEDTLNIIKIEACDNNSNLLSDRVIKIYHDSNIEDLEKPVIVNTRIFMMDSNSFVPHHTPEITIIVYDNISGVKNVSIKSAQIISQAIHDTGFFWKDSLFLDHGKNSIAVMATDSVGNISDTLILSVIQNKLPGIAISFPHYILNDTLYSDTLSPFDKDNDSVTISLQNNIIAGLTLSKSNFLSWNTKNLALGDTSLSLILSDGYQDTTITCFFTVVDSMQIFDSIAFAITEQSFPEIIIAETETLNVILSIVTKTGKKPFTFHAYNQKMDTILLDNSNDSLLFWIPLAKDTGVHQFIISVTDELGTTDILTPEIIILPKNNAPCSLLITCPDSSIELINNTLNLELVNDTVDLFCTIIDTDHPLTEHYTVTQILNNNITTFSPDAAFFTIRIFPKNDIAIETLTLILNDNTNTFDTTIITIIHKHITNPDEINNLLFWFDANSIASLLDKDKTPISSANQDAFYWVSKTGNNDTLKTQSGITLKTDNNNAKDFYALNFNQIYNDNMHKQDTSKWSESNYSVFVVARSGNSDNTLHPLVSTSHNSNSYSLGIKNKRMVTELNMNNNSSTAESNMSVSANSLYLFSYIKKVNRLKSGMITFFLNGNSSNHGEPFSNPPTSTLIIGSEFTTGSQNSWNHHISEILIYNKDIDQTEIEMLQDYFNAKYGISF